MGSDTTKRATSVQKKSSWSSGVSERMTTLRRKVPFPSWSWIGWEGVINLRVEDQYVELG